ncbi:hypothetical protein V9T40_013134 [Parthenolecanium corni]|uniref:Uncharacterized protein n=1 Tax=Parthenolecanium corni TaxID=536013 RepID=A0AAN9TIJ0_9HEMI
MEIKLGDKSLVEPLEEEKRKSAVLFRLDEHLQCVLVNAPTGARLECHVISVLHGSRRYITEQRQSTGTNNGTSYPTLALAVFVL